MHAPWKKTYDESRQWIKKQKHHFAGKDQSSQSYGFSSNHVWELNHKESWALENWCFWTVVLERALESPLGIKKIKPVNPKGNQFEYSFKGLILKLKLQYLATWCKELTHWKRPWSWERLKQDEKGPMDNEMLGWHHQLNGHEFEQTPGDNEGQVSLVCYSPWCRRIGHGCDQTGRRQWHPTPVLLPGKSHEWRNLVGCSPWGSLRVGHDWVTSLSLFTFMHWKRKWQPTTVFLPGESQGWGAWWVAVYGVAQSQTQLKQLSSSSSDWTELKKYVILFHLLRFDSFLSLGTSSYLFHFCI